ncbi:HAD domain-containing protein [Ammoniphilus sp. YIM 78166]|uniref:HAD domain-containing protein n=1 Tax=Ammoniphilus sp. YIM 78166 TaxID=1644106 RepID=UPI00106FB4BF|nr:HAD domain-containing protein [Ammoniphilus sp. YIM 78166]
MKVIFLDIDGVMITGTHLKPSHAYNGYEFAPVAVENLKEIIEQTGAAIVVSSTWRTGGFAFLQNMFHSNGIAKGLVGQTPVIHYASRGQEIQQYIEESKWDPTLKVDRFIILDDNDDMGHLRSYLVRTHWRTGLDEEAKEQAIQMLLGKKE